MASTVRTDKVGPVSGSADFTLPTSDGTAGQFLKTDGSLGLGFATVASTVYGLNSVQTITASGTWTKPTGVTKIIVEVQAGGGGAGWDRQAGAAGGPNGTGANMNDAVANTGGGGGAGPNGDGGSGVVIVAEYSKPLKVSGMWKMNDVYEYETLFVHHHYSY